MQSLQHFTEIINNFMSSGPGRNNSAFWELFLFKSSAIFDNLQYIKTLRVRTYIDIHSFLKNKILRDIIFIEEFDVVGTNVKKFSSKKFEIHKADWTIYPYHLLYTKDKIVEFIGYFRNLYLDLVHKHFMTVSSNIISKYINFSISLEKIVLSEIFSNAEWKTSTVIIRGKPCLSKLIIKEITDFDLYLKNFKYKPVNLNKFKTINVLANNIYFESSDLFKNSYNYFQTLSKFKNHHTHFLPPEKINYNCKIWTKFFPENIILYDNFDFFIYSQDFNIYFKSVVTSSFDFTNNKLIFNKESDKFRNIISFSNVFVHPNIRNVHLGLFITYKTDSDLFKLFSTIFLFSIYDNSMLSEWFNSLYFNFSKDLIINNKSDFGILYKTIGGWNNYSELNFATNGKWFFESKIVDKKILYDWKWKRNLNTFVPKVVYNVNHFDFEKKVSNFPEIKIKISPNSVSNRIDKKVLGQILVSKELVKDNVFEIQNEALRTMWEDYRRYRTRRLWRHFPHHAAYVEKYFTDPKTRKK